MAMHIRMCFSSIGDCYWYFLLRRDECRGIRTPTSTQGHPLERRACLPIPPYTGNRIRSLRAGGGIRTRLICFTRAAPVLTSITGNGRGARSRTAVASASKAGGGTGPLLLPSTPYGVRSRTLSLERAACCQLHQRSMCSVRASHSPTQRWETALFARPRVPERRGHGQLDPS